MLLQLERDGVQIFVATHDYYFAKYLEIRKTINDNIIYHALYSKGSHVLCEHAHTFEGLSNNAIIDQSIRMYKEEIAKVMK